MPVLLWGNGACVDNGLAHAAFLREIASHGYLVIACFTGGPTDIAHPNTSDDVSRIKHAPVFFGWLPVGHGGTFSAPD